MPQKNYSGSFADGDNLVLIDDQTEVVLYGHEVLREAIRRQKSLESRVVRIPAEAYISLLRCYFPQVKEVRHYLTESERTDSINPDGGKSLEAVSNTIWIERRHLNAILDAIKNNPEVEDDDREGEGWKNA